MGPLGTPWDHLGPLGTTWDHLGPRGTTWDPLGPRGTTWIVSRGSSLRGQKNLKNDTCFPSGPIFRILKGIDYLSTRLVRK